MLKGRKILITGAGSGIGAETARLFAAEGAQVALLDREAAAVQRIAAEVGGRAFAADISDEAAITAAVDAAAEATGGLDGLVNAAGIATMARLQDTSLAEFQHILAVNVAGTFLVTLAAVPHLQRAEGATITSIASASGILPSTAGGAYGTSKAAVDMMMKYFARELAPQIRVNSVCPGTVDTPMAAAMTKGADPAQIAAMLRSTYALQRAATAGEIAEALLFLTSRRSSFVTGISLAVDGGRTFH